MENEEIKSQNAILVYIYISKLSNKMIIFVSNAFLRSIKATTNGSVFLLLNDVCY